MGDTEIRCSVCMHHCKLKENGIGICGSRIAKGDHTEPLFYGKLSALALDPIEKKPLYMFHPGSMILSAGGFGCNLSCPFCQNFGISKEFGGESRYSYSPEELRELAVRLSREEGNIGLAFTYNEPTINFEFVRETEKLIHEAGLFNVLVTNGSVTADTLEMLLPYTDAMNIDLKAFSEEGYRKLGGDLDTVKEFIKTAAASCHVEITSLIVPGINDDVDEMEAEARWIAETDRSIPLHITRYFPRYRYEEPPTSIALLRELSERAKKYLDNVFLGNV